MRLMELHNDGVSGNKVYLHTGANDRLQATHAPSNGSAKAWLNEAFVLNVWHSAVAVFASNSSRTIYMTGATPVTNTTAQSSISGIDILRVGKYGWNTPTHEYHANAAVCDAAIWDAALTTDQVGAYLAGWSPLKIARSDLACYIPFGGLDGDHDRDLISDTTLTAYNSPTWTDHPSGLIYRDEPKFIRSTESGGGWSLDLSALRASNRRRIGAPLTFNG